MSVLFVVGLLLQNNGVADIGYGIAFMVVMLATAVQTYPITFYSGLLCLMVCVWGFRLAIRIFLKNRGTSEDFRYKAWRDTWGSTFVVRSFFQIYLLQGLVVFTVVLPVMLALVYPSTTVHLELFVIGMSVWVIGFLFESIGDYQLDSFLKNSENKGKIMMSGLWKYSRHPNYFGESTMWVGIALASSAVVTVPMAVWLSPLLITFLLLKVSGVPMLEKRWEGNPDWEIYKKRTSVFFPLFPKN